MVLAHIIRLLLEAQALVAHSGVHKHPVTWIGCMSRDGQITRSGGCVVIQVARHAIRMTW